jgi:hypothetical protein
MAAIASNEPQDQRPRESLHANLDEQTIIIHGLEKTMTDVLVQISLLQS